jgi:tRNA C32,U32 (ribose-2'-O)-methylase TrmJ
MPPADSVESQLERLGDRMDAFIASQAEFNRNINDNLKELSKTYTQAQTQQVEINNLHKIVTTLSNKCDKNNDSVAEIKVNQAVLMEFKKEVIWLKRWVAGLFASMVSVVATMIIK